MTGLLTQIKNDKVRQVTEKVAAGTRITPEDGIMLYNNADLPILGLLSGIARRRINGNLVYYNKNFHIEPTNKCVFNCLFCSYHKPAADPESWELSQEQMLGIVEQFDNKDVTEVHIVGGVHPSYDIYYYGELIRKIRLHRPLLHIKAFSAIELDFMIKKAGVTIEEGLIYLKNCGLDSIPGGGAEIFDEKLREKICNEKTSSETWLKIHETAHLLGIPSNATMLYGHIETFEHRVDHMNRLRKLQDKTGGFNAFIPLKYKKANNNMSYLDEVSVIEDLRNYAVARIFLDNIPHLKAYWPMISKASAQLSLLFGADDIDGTIDDTTKIYSMAGSEEKNPSMTTDEICKLIREAGFVPIERDSLFNRI